MRNDDPAATLACLATQSLTGIDLDRFALSWNLDAADARDLWTRADLRVIRDGDSAIGIARSAWDRLAEKLLDTLRLEHERAPDMIGVEPERLRRMTLARLARPVFEALTAELLASGALARTRTWLHRPEHRASVSAEDRALFATFEPLLDAHPFNPPRVRDVSKATGTPEHLVRRLFKRLARAG